MKYHSAQSMPNFVPRHDSLSIHSCALRGGNLYCGPPITLEAHANTRVLALRLRKSMAPCFRTRPTVTQGAHHIHSTAGVPITMSCNLLFRLDNLQLSLVAVSSEIFFHTVADVCPVDFFVEHRSGASVNTLASPKKAAMHGRAFFQRNCNVPDCDP